MIANRLEEAKQSVDKDELPPHELRFYAHLILFIYKLTNESDNRIFDKVLLRFIDLLIRMHLYAIVPFYLHQLFDKRIAKNKMIDFLEGDHNIYRSYKFVHILIYIIFNRDQKWIRTKNRSWPCIRCRFWYIWSMS